MKRWKLGVGLAVLASSLFVLAGSASAHATAVAAGGSEGDCVVHSLSSFIAQGEFAASATTADIVEVECNPDVYGTGSPVKITANQLFNRCGGKLTWIVPNPFRKVTGKSISVTLDVDGNATVALIAGPGCQTGESLVSAHLELEPFETFTTSYTVLPALPTKEGVFALPWSQVEDAGSSAVATIVQAEFNNGSEKPVQIAAEELYTRCRAGAKLRWFDMRNITTVKFKATSAATSVTLTGATPAELAGLAIGSELEANPSLGIAAGTTVTGLNTSGGEVEMSKAATAGGTGIVTGIIPPVPPVKLVTFKATSTGSAELLVPTATELKGLAVGAEVEENATLGIPAGTTVIAINTKAGFFNRVTLSNPAKNAGTASVTAVVTLKAELVETIGPELTGLRLDNDGNAFAIAVGESSCAPGPSTIEADLEAKPFSTQTATFLIEPPRPTI